MIDSATTIEDVLILVDENDHELGGMNKLAVHQQGLLHRAFSVFIFNSDNELLLQQRADDKYHSGGLWTNTCCSHPRVGEELNDAVDRRLKEEMGPTKNGGKLKVNPGDKYVLTIEQEGDGSLDIGYDICKK